MCNERAGRSRSRAWLAAAALLAAAAPGPAAAVLAAPPPNLTIAFFGDQGLGENAEAVLELVASEGAEALFHLGDFDYDHDPEAWEQQLDAFLGPDFPVFGCVGNHDTGEFYGPDGYQVRLEQRMQTLGIPWSGDLGVQSSFEFDGVFFVVTAPGIYGEGDGYHDTYIRDELAANDSLWRVSAWHQNMKRMQTGGKASTTGWGVYEESRRGGAIVATAHEHAYARTHLLSDMENQVVASTEPPLDLAVDDPETPGDQGASFVFVSGLGGENVADQEREGPWWASIYTSTQGATFGALFGVFHFQGDPGLARFYFKDIDGNVVDDFLVRSPFYAPEPGPGRLGACALATLAVLRVRCRRRHAPSR